MPPRAPHPWVFSVLIVPFGALGGYFGVTLSYVLSHAGVSVAQVAGIVALAVFPHTVKFLWAPVADTTLNRRGWYAIAALTTALGIAAAALLPATRPGIAALGAVVFLASLATTVLGMSVEGLIAYDTPQDERGRVSGWFQAGILGGAGIGGGAALWLSQRWHDPRLAGIALAVACLACAAVLPLVPEPVVVRRRAGLARDVAEVAHDLWTTCRTRAGWLAVLLCVLPIGTGAAGGLFAAIARDWHASGDAVALAGGLLGGLAAIAGCGVGGWISDRMGRQTAYALFSLLQAACVAAMALAPRTQTSFLLFAAAYAMLVGLTYAGFSAFVLEAIGRGAAATKYSVYASLSNLPLYVMTRLEGRAHDAWGPVGLLWLEAACAVGGLAIFGVAAALSSRRDHSMPIGVPDPISPPRP